MLKTQLKKRQKEKENIKIFQCNSGQNGFPSKLFQIFKEKIILISCKPTQRRVKGRLILNLVRGAV